MASLASFLGSVLGYGTQGVPAYQQLQAQGIAGAPQINTTEEEQDAAQQSAALTQLQGLANGTGPSVAQGQLSAGLQQSIAAQQAAAAGGRYGQNAALRQRQAAQTAAGLQAGAANQATQTRAQEQQAGIQGSAQLAGQMRGQALAQSTAQAQLQQGYNQQLANLYGAEQGQTAQAAEQLQSSGFNALGSLGGGFLSGAAHGAILGMDSGGVIPTLNINPVSATSYTPFPAAYSSSSSSKSGPPPASAGGDVGTSNYSEDAVGAEEAQGGITGLDDGGVVPTLDIDPVRATSYTPFPSGSKSGGSSSSSGSSSALLALAAKHGAVSSGVTRIGERGPELFLPEHGQAKLIDRPGLVRLGQNGRDVVVPLKKGSAPYHHGPAPMQQTPMPSKPAPKNPKIMESAKKAMAGKGKVFSPGPHAAGLSPKTAPIVVRAMADHGIRPDGKDAKTLLQKARVARAMKYAAR
jgi:hypothetical protein